MDSLVSIITPSYNSSNYIESCVQSVIDQTYTNWEMLIVDDCSSDDSFYKIQLIASKDTRIKIFQNSQNIGAANTRNIALKKARGKFIAFLDSDDMWNKDKLDKQINFMLLNNIAFSYTAYEMITDTSLNVFKVIKAPKKMHYHSYLKNTIIGCLTVVLDREKIGDFEMPNIRSSHDMALWLSIMKRGYDAFGLDINLAQYRILPNSNSSRKLKAAKDVWLVYRNIEGLSFVYSLWCFINYVVNALIKRM